MNIVADGVFNFGRQFFFVQALLIGSIVGLFDRLRLSRRRFGSTLYVSCASIVIYAVIADFGQFLQVIMWRLINLFVVMTLTQIVGLGLCEARRSRRTLAIGKGFPSMDQPG